MSRHSDRVVAVAVRERLGTDALARLGSLRRRLWWRRMFTSSRLSRQRDRRQAGTDGFRPVFFLVERMDDSEPDLIQITGKDEVSPYDLTRGRITFRHKG